MKFALFQEIVNFNRQCDSLTHFVWCHASRVS